MKYLKAGIPAITVVAALAGIYSAKEAPYTHIAAASVLIGAALTIWQNVGSARSAEATRQRLLRLTLSSEQWKETVAHVVKSVARSNGYLIAKIITDRNNFTDADGSRVFVFAEDVYRPFYPSALLVVNPNDFAYLATLDSNDLENQIHRIMFGSFGKTNIEKDLADLATRIGEIASCLYILRHWGEGGFKVAVSPNHQTLSIGAVIGSTSLMFSKAELENLVELPYLQMTLRIWESLMRADPSPDDYVLR